MVECVFPGAGIGAGPLGSMPAGSQTPEGLALISAFTLTANSVRVEFRGLLDDFGSPLEADSPLNPANWMLIALDPPDAQLRLVQTVTLQNLTDLGGEFVLFFDGVLQANAQYQLELTLPEVQLTLCSTVTFVGIPTDPSALPTDIREDDGFIRDIANPFLKRNTVNVGVSPVGTYQINDKGDFALDVSGVAGLRKRLFRRVITAADGFLLLQGYGLTPGLKSRITPDLAGRLQSLAQSQTLQEPEVAQVNVSVARVPTDPNVLTLLIRARTQNGQDIDVVVPISLP